MISRRLNLILAASGALAVTQLAYAVPFNSFDPRSMAMGGAGVAVGDAAMAPLFNPALLAVARKQDDFSMELPIVGARVYDPDNFKNSLDNFQNNNYTSTLDNIINSINSSGANSANLTSAANATDALSSALGTLSDKPIQGEVGLAMVVGIPSKTVGAALLVNGWGAAGGIVHYRDSQTLADFSQALNQLSACTTSACATGVYNSYPQFFDSSTGQVTFNTSQLKSSVDIQGAAIGEVGLSLAHEFTIGGETLAIGITPKMVKTVVFDYAADVQNANTSNFNNSDYTTTYSDANFDIGIAKNYDNGWRTGLVVKNVIGHTYDFMAVDPNTGIKTKTGATLKTSPQARVGVSYQNSWATVALDADLTKNDPAGFEDKSQYVALGAELNAWDWAQLRVGYRADLVNSARNVVSAGIGLSPFGVHLDLAVAGNSNEIGAALDFGFRF